MDHDNQVILSLLTALEEDPHTTQKNLSTHLGIAVGMVNSYLKRVIYKGYVKTKQLERRRLHYLLTPKGIQEKSRLTYEFLQFSYQYIRRVRRQVYEILLPLVKEGKTKVVIYGSGEMAELAYLALKELNMELVGLIDPSHSGEQCLGQVIQDTFPENWKRSTHVVLILNSKVPDFILHAIENTKDGKIDVVHCP